MADSQDTPRALKVLILEDQEGDAVLMAHELRKAGNLVSWKRVDTEKEFLQELDGGGYDVVLSDYNLPSFNAQAALNLFHERKLDIPFIVVTGSLGEEQAVELMRLGASDYLIKDRLARLDGAIKAALEQKRLRDKNREALEQLRYSEERFRRLAENAPDVIYRYRLLPQPGYDYLSPAVERLTGYPVEAFYNDPTMIERIVYPDDLPVLVTQLSNEVFMQAPSIMRWVRKDGSLMWTELRNAGVFNEQGQLVAVEGIARDITDRVQREREHEAMIAVAAALRDAMTRVEIYPVLLEKAMDLLKGDAAALVTINREHIKPGHLVEASQGHWADWQGARLEIGPRLYQQVIEEGSAFLTEDAQDPSHDLPAPWTAGLSRLTCVPLRLQEEVVGMLWVGCKCEQQGLSQPAGTTRLLNAIADIAASALHRARLYEETQQRVQHLTALRTIDRAITASLDLHLMMNVLVDQLIIQKDVDGVSLLLVDPYTHQLSHTQSRGFHGRSQEGRSLRMGESLAGRVVLERRILHIPDLNEYPETWSQKTQLLSEGFRAYLGVPLIAKGEVLGVLEILRQSVHSFDVDWLEFIEALVGQVAIAINNAALFEKLQRTTYDIIQGYDETIEGWSRALEMREIETRGHTNRAVWLTTTLARRLGVPDSDLVHLRRGVLLHDIGKMALPDSILLKPGPLDEEEVAHMRQHPTYAFEWLSPIIYLHPALDIPYCHHEFWNGSGYPRKLKGPQIPLAARIFAVVDVWDALRSDRPFRSAWPKEQALEYIRDMAGIQFDPHVVAAFLELVASEGLDEEDF